MHIFSGLNFGLGYQNPYLKSSLNAFDKFGGTLSVNASNGNLVLNRQLGQMMSEGMNFDWGDTYNTKNGDFVFAFSSKLRFGSTQHVIYRQNFDGHEETFIFDSKSNQYISSEEGLRSVIHQKEGQYIFEEASGKQVTYDTKGRLISVLDRLGQGFFAIYEGEHLISVTDRQHHQSLSWTFENNRLTNISCFENDSLQYQIKYSYDSLGRLSSVQKLAADNIVYDVHYGYVGTSHLINDIQETGGIHYTFSYDDNGRISSFQDGDAHWSFTYEDHETCVTDPNQQLWRYHYDDYGHLIEIKPPLGDNYQYFYEDNNLRQITHGNMVWTYEYNAEGDCTGITNPNGTIYKYDYDEKHRLIHIYEKEHGRIVLKDIYIYDANGLLQYHINKGMITQYEYNADKQCCLERSYYNFVYEGDNTAEALSSALKMYSGDYTDTHYLHDFRGNVIAIDRTSKLNNTSHEHTEMTYDPFGHLLTKTMWLHGEAKTTSYLYDALGRMIFQKDAEGYQSWYLYDDIHQKVTSVDALGRQWIRLYDGDNKCISEECLYQGSVIGNSHYFYDVNGRLIREEKSDGRMIRYEYDALGNCLFKIDEEGRAHGYVYDNASKLIKETHVKQRIYLTKDMLQTSLASLFHASLSESDDVIYRSYTTFGALQCEVNGRNQVTKYHYDEKGRLCLKTIYASLLNNISQMNLLDLPVSPDDRSTYFEYDDNDNLIRKIDVEGGVIDYQYDVRGLCIEEIRYATRFILDAFSHEMKPQVSIQDRHHYFHYDSFGNLNFEVDARGFVTAYEYDDNNLCLSKTRYYVALSKLPPEESALSSLMTHPNDEITYYYYDVEKRLVRTWQKGGAITEFTYDADSRVTSKKVMSDKLCRETLYRYDAEGRVIAQLDPRWVGLLSKDSEHIWEEYAHHYKYDINGHLIEESLGKTLLSKFYYDKSYQVTYHVTGEGQVIMQERDAFSKVVSERHYVTRLQNIEYENFDSINKALKHMESSHDELTSYFYDARGNLKERVNGLHHGESYSYDAFDALIDKDILGVFTHTLYQYDHLGHVKSQEHGQDKSTYAYNIFGERIESYINQQKTGFNYDKTGNLIQETNAMYHSKFYEFDAFGRLISKSNIGNSINTRYVYEDGSHKVLVYADNGVKILETTFDAFGDKVELSDGNGHKTYYQYDLMGNVSQEVNAIGQQKIYFYDNFGRLIERDNEVGIIDTWEYDRQGNLLTVTKDIHGLALKTSYEYDAFNRNFLMTDALGIKTAYTYNQEGLLTDTIYDKDGLSIRSHYEYNLDFALIRKTVFNPMGCNEVTAYEYDMSGRRIALIIDPDGLAIKTRYIYNDKGLLSCLIDAKGHETHYVYDALSQCRFVINNMGFVTEHRYDANGRNIALIHYEKALNKLSEYSETTLSQHLIYSSNDRYTLSVWNDKDELTAQCHPDGSVIQYFYDNAGNRCQEKNYSVHANIKDWLDGRYVMPNEINSRDIYHIYNHLNQCVFIIEGIGHITEFTRNFRGDIISEKSLSHIISMSSLLGDFSEDNVRANCIYDAINDRTVENRYDTLGRLLERDTREGYTLHYEYDARGHVLRVQKHPMNRDTAQEDRVAYFAYDALGREILQCNEQGILTQKFYDALGNIIEEHRFVSHRKVFDDNSLKNSLIDNSNFYSTHFHWDATKRLLEKTDAFQKTHAYTYDALGNIISEINESSYVWKYDYDELNHCIRKYTPVIKTNRILNGKVGVDERSIQTVYEYDAFGQLVKTIEDFGGLNKEQVYHYDAMGRKTIIEYHNQSIQSGKAFDNNRHEEIITAYEKVIYNSFGEIIAKVDKAGRMHHYVYNESHYLAFDIDSIGGVIEYRYTTFGEIAQKIRYVERIQLLDDYSMIQVKKALKKNDEDRHECFDYDNAGRCISVRYDAVLSYQPETKTYQKMSPETTITYNVFGDVTSKTQKVNNNHRITEYWYYDTKGCCTASIDGSGYLNQYQFDDLGRKTEEKQSYIKVTHYDQNIFDKPLSSKQDRITQFSYDALDRLTEKRWVNVRFQKIVQNKMQTVEGDSIVGFAYDALGHMTQMTDEYGFKTIYQYDALGQMILTVKPKTSLGYAATSYGFDGLGHLIISRQYALSATSGEHSYQINESVKDKIILNQYNTEGDVITHIDGEGYQTNYSYDVAGNRVREWKKSSENNHIKNHFMSYDHQGHILLNEETIDDKIRKDSFSYNVFGELILKQRNGHLNTYYDYNQSGRVWRSNASGHAEIYLYDGLGRLTETVTSTNVFRPEFGERGFDLGKISLAEYQSFSGDNRTFDFSRQDNRYDDSGFIISHHKDVTLSGEIPSIKTVRETYLRDRFGNMLEHISAQGYKTCYEYNHLNKVIHQILPEVTIVDEHGIFRQAMPELFWGYDAFGNVIGYIDARGNLTYKVYDEHQKIIEEHEANLTFKTRHYNLLDDMESLTDARHNTTYYDYDHEQKLIAIRSPLATHRYRYDESGNVMTESLADGEVIEYTYDDANQLLGKREQGRQWNYYAYDLDGHKVLQKDGNGHAQSWDYDDAGRLKKHVTLGKDDVSYQYNTNGLLIQETSSHGRNVRYHYTGDGRTERMEDLARLEVLSYTYDDEGFITDKKSSRGGVSDGVWLMEQDHYDYDAQHRLINFHRKNPDDIDSRTPNEDHSLLSVAYGYDESGNVRFTKTDARYKGHQYVHRDDWFTYDALGRIVVSKGVLDSGFIRISDHQGTELRYDNNGNILSADTYDHNNTMNYSYSYDAENHLQTVTRNHHFIQSKEYDALGRVIESNQFNDKGERILREKTFYKQGLLHHQEITERSDSNRKTITNTYDDADNLMTQEINSTDTRLTHHYLYELGENYLQTYDKTELLSQGRSPSHGESRRYFDINGQLERVEDKQTEVGGGHNEAFYWSSLIDGVKAKRDRDGITSYLTLGGKTIGDIQLRLDGSQALTVYGGFSPIHGQETEIGKNPELIWDVDTESNMHGIKSTTISLPQQDSGAYYVAAGDTLESIAFAVYGDKSLWYVIADANGLAAKNADSSIGLTMGMRVEIPSLYASHYRSDTHRVLKSSDIYSDMSATTLMSFLHAPIHHHNRMFSMFLMALISVALTTLIGGVVGSMVLGQAIPASLGGLLTLGQKVLSQGVLGNAVANGIARFSTLFLSQLAEQGAGNALGYKKGFEPQKAVFQALTSVAASGLTHFISDNKLLNEAFSPKDVSKPSNFSSFNFSKGMGAFFHEGFSEMFSQRKGGLSIHPSKWILHGVSTGIFEGKLIKKAGDTLTGSVLNSLGDSKDLFQKEAMQMVKRTVELTLSGHKKDIALSLSRNLGALTGQALQQHIIHTDTDIKDIASPSEPLMRWQGEKFLLNKIYQSTLKRVSKTLQVMGEKSAEFTTDYITKAGIMNEVLHQGHLKRTKDVILASAHSMKGIYIHNLGRIGTATSLADVAKHVDVKHLDLVSTLKNSSTALTHKATGILGVAFDVAYVGTEIYNGYVEHPNNSFIQKTKNAVYRGGVAGQALAIELTYTYIGANVSSIAAGAVLGQPYVAAATFVGAIGGVIIANYNDDIVNAAKWAYGASRNELNHLYNRWNTPANYSWVSDAAYYKVPIL